MQQFSEEQLEGIRSLREDLVKVREKFEHLRLPNTEAVDVVWSRLSNAHAALGHLLAKEDGRFSKARAADLAN